jgi:hypothetical protein
MKVAQYGQWDGQPSGQGLTAFEFIKENLDKMERRFGKEVEQSAPFPS